MAVADITKSQASVVELEEVTATRLRAVVQPRMKSDANHQAAHVAIEECAKLLKSRIIVGYASSVDEYS